MRVNLLYKVTVLPNDDFLDAVGDDRKLDLVLCFKRLSGSATKT